jgi:general secretion pathway protein A
MYREHFGLKLKPFSITPDPKFLYMSPGHKEALAHLLYGLKEGSGFVVITGEVGTGKTTILNAFLLKLPPRIPKVVIKNPHINPDNLYFLLGEAISMPEEKRSRNYINEFEDRLKTMGGAVLIVDESQGLSYEMLEEIRLLSNLETVHEKLVQIMLLGQQELNEKLNSSQLRQLKQRIGVKYHIAPLDSNETKDYIDHRLRVAGYEPREEPLFTSSAFGEIYRYTRGFPRLINIVCDNVLLAAYSDDLNQVSAGLVKKVVGGMEKTYARHAPHIPGQNLSERKGLKGLWVGLTAAAAFLIFIAALVVVLLLPLGQNIMDKAKDMLGISHESSSLSNRAQRPLTTLSMKESEGAALRGLPKVSIQDQAGESAAVPPTFGEQKQTIGVTMAVGPGDTVAKLAARHYGRVDSGILDIVRKANSSLGNIDLIYEGQKINLPPITDTARVMFTVSVASYHSINEATAVFLDLVKKGFKATIYPHLDTQGNTWYRVTIGTFREQDKADVYARQLKTQGFLYAKSVKVSVEG